MDGPVSPWGAAASLALVAVAVVLSRWRRLHVEGSILWASARAAIQLVAVGLLLTVILESAGSWLWAWLWVVGMVLVSADVARRRARHLPHLLWMALAAIGLATLVALGLVFLPDIIDPEPVTLVVIAGITLGNTMPSVVLAVDQVSRLVIDQAGQVEALLALGFDARGATRFVVERAARTALIPQIERTKVVGLIALPGAMVGLLLAGVDPVDAVLAQLVIMYVILGSVATSVVTMTLAAARAAFTPDLRLAAWAQTGAAR